MFLATLNRDEILKKGEIIAMATNPRRERMRL